MKKGWKIWPTLLCVSMVLVMSGCGASQGQSDKKEGEKQSTEAVKDPMAKYDEPVEITTAVAIDVVMQQLLAVQSDVETNNSWYNGYKNDLGIEIKNVWSVPSSQYEEKLNAAISADELPDVCQVSQEQLKVLVDNGMVMDITDLFDKYATDFTKKMMDEDDNTALSQCKVNGKLYALPDVGGNHDMVPIMWIRKDWMEKLGMSAPKSVDDLEKLAKAFCEQDPDGNGQNDTYGIALTNKLYDEGAPGMTGIMEMFGAHNGWVDSDGKAAYGLVQPEMKTVLEKLNEWYNSGILDKEFVAKDATKVNEEVVAGKVGIMFGNHINAFYPMPNAKTLNPEADWMPYPIPGVNGELPKIMVGSSANGYYVVSSKCKNPEAIMKIYNYFYQKDCALSEDYDPKFHATGDTTKHPGWAMNWAVIKTFYPRQNLFIYNGVKSYLDGDKKAAENPWVSSNIEQVEGYMKDPSNVSYYGSYIWCGPEGAFSVVDSYEKNNQRIQNLYIYGNTGGMSMYNVTLDQLTKETFTKIITGEKKASDFDGFVEQWNQLGGEQITSEVNDFIKK